MLNRFRLFALLLCLPLAATARAEVSVTVEKAAEGAASADFRFEKVPAPSTTDAANRAKLTVVAGRPDANGGRLRVLNDGKTPAGEDEPRSNFFFAPRTEEGRVLVDLGEPTAIRRINTYSWHPGSRGPQVYKIYGDDSGAKDFDADSAKAEDLADAGWKLIAAVDTRPADGAQGGQYGVSIAPAKGRTLGKHQRLLFVVEPTETESPFGQTFFSEIDVDDGKRHEAPEEVAPIVVRVGDQYEITFDASEAPEMLPWIKETLIPICREWYPKIVELLPSEGYAAPERFTIFFHADMPGVAHCAGSDIHCAVPWFSQNLEGEAPGAVVHEMVHVVQQYGRSRGANRNPGWMVEGVADYIRWHLYEPAERRRRPNPDGTSYTDSYHVTAAFLDYLAAEHDPQLVEKFNAAMRNGEYDETLWEEFTGKTVDQLWADYTRSLRR